MEPRTASICPVRICVITFTLLMPCTVPTATAPTATSSSALCNKNQYYNVRHYQCLDKCGNDTRCGLHQICDQPQGQCRDLCAENVTCEITQYCDSEREKCLPKCGILPGCKSHQTCDRYNGDCLDLCGENDTITCNVTLHCDRNLGMCLDRCGPGNNTKCGQFEYCDRDREVCLHLCGPDNNIKCRENKYCEAKRSTTVCTSYCFKECHDTLDNPMFCDTTVHRCKPCHPVCDAYHIRHFPDCKIFCNDELREFNEKPNGSLITAELSYVTTTKVLLMADHPSNNTSLIIGVLAVVLFVVLVATIWLVVFRFKRKPKFKGKSTRSFLGCCGRNENCARRSRKLTGSGEISANASDQTQITTVVDDQGDESDLNESQRALMKHSPHAVEVHAVATASGAESRLTEADELLPSQHECNSSVRQSSLTQSDGTNLHNSSHERVTTFGNEHLSLSSGGQDGSIAGALDIDCVIELSETPPLVDEKLSVPQQVTEPHRDWHHVPRDGIDLGMGNMPDLMKLPLVPPQQAYDEERAHLSQIISGFYFVVFHLFAQNTITVSVRPSDITLGEAKRVLIEAGVPEDMLEVELFRYADDSIDSGVVG